MKTYTLEQLMAKGIAERPTDRSIITTDGHLYIQYNGEWVETGAVALDIAGQNSL